MGAGYLHASAAPPVTPATCRASGSKTTPEQLGAYLRDPLAIDPSGRMPNMLLTKEEADDLARYLCQDGAEMKLPKAPDGEQIISAFRRVEDAADELAAFRKRTPEAQLIDLGQRIVIARGCNNCHTIEPDGKPFASVLASASFDDLKKPEAQERGCLRAGSVSDGRTVAHASGSFAPWFALSAADRLRVRRFLTDGTKGAKAPAPAVAVRTLFQRFNCLACHTRDGEGGLSAKLIEELRQSEKADHAEAVVPPSLTGTAHKLRMDWMCAVLTEGRRVRPG